MLEPLFWIYIGGIVLCVLALPMKILRDGVPPLYAVALGTVGWPAMAVVGTVLYGVETYESASIPDDWKCDTCGSVRTLRPILVQHEDRKVSKEDICKDCQRGHVLTKFEEVTANA